MSTDSKLRILEAAIQVFAEKGPHGARMEDIGAAANINKAMVYYYYSNKDNLFQEAINLIIRQIYSEILKGMRETADSNDDPVHMLTQFARYHFMAFSKRKEWTLILFDALSNHPERVGHAFMTAFEAENTRAQKKVEQAFKRGVEMGVFRDIDFQQVFISIIGMNIIYFVARPIAETILDLEIKDEQEFLKAREDSIIDLLLRGIVKDNSQANG